VKLDVGGDAGTGWLPCKHGVGAASCTVAAPGPGSSWAATRVGGEVALFDAKGGSNISVADFAHAIVEEICNALQESPSSVAAATRVVLAWTCGTSRPRPASGCPPQQGMLHPDDRDRPQDLPGGDHRGRAPAHGSYDSFAEGCTPANRRQEAGDGVWRVAPLLGGATTPAVGCTSFSRVAAGLRGVAGIVSRSEAVRLRKITFAVARTRTARGCPSRRRRSGCPTDAVRAAAAEGNGRPVIRAASWRMTRSARGQAHYPGY
jgi:hypothetical protein